MSAHDTPEVGSGEAEGRWNRRGEFVPEFPASPDPVQPADAGEGLSEGEITPLAQSLYRTAHLNLPLADSLDIDCHDAARAFLASDWLAAREAAWAEKYAVVVGERDTARKVATMYQRQIKDMQTDERKQEVWNRAESAEAALATALRQKAEDRARVEAVEALAEQYDDDAAREPYGGEPWTTTAEAIRAALAIPTATGDE